MAISQFKVKGKPFEYDTDMSWAKWKHVISDEMNEFQKTNWIVDNVLLVPDGATYLDTLKAADHIARKFKVRAKPMKSYLKRIGKMFRGTTIVEFQHKAIEYQILREMKGAITLKELQKMDFLDVIFYRRMLYLEYQREMDMIKKQEAQMKSKTGRRGRH